MCNIAHTDYDAIDTPDVLSISETSEEIKDSNDSAVVCKTTLQTYI